MTDTTGIPEDDRDGRAAEYVLGTLTLDERLAFEAALPGNAALRRAVAEWSVRLQPLADAVPSEAPPAGLRARLLQEIAPQTAAAQRPFSIARWLGWTFGLSALAGAAAVVLVLLFTPQPPQAGGFALLHRTDQADKAVIAFQVDKSLKDMVVLAQVAPPEAGKDYELWLLPSGKAPLSLGVVKTNVRAERPLPEAARPYMKDFANLAVSVEAAGGSPSGAPTGPIVFVGAMRLMDQLTVTPPESK